MDRYLAFTGAMFAVDQLVEGKGGLFIGLEKQ